MWKGVYTPLVDLFELVKNQTQQALTKALAVELVHWVMQAWLGVEQ